MAFNLLDAFVEISTRSKVKKELTRDRRELDKLEKKSKKTTDKMTKGFKQTSKAAAGLGTAFKGAIAAIGVGVALRQISNLVNLMGIQEKAEAKLAAVIRSTGGAARFSAKQLNKYASELQRVTTFSDETTISALAILATFKEISGDVFLDTIRVAQDMATVLGTDLNAAVLQLGKAINDPILGLTMLRRVGVSFNDEQTKMIQRLARTNKLFEAQQLILKELQSEFGGAAEAVAKTRIGSIEQAKNKAGDLGEAIGRRLADPFFAPGGLFSLPEHIKERFGSSSGAPERPTARKKAASLPKRQQPQPGSPRW